MQRTKSSYSSFVHSTGTLLIIISLVGFLYTYGPILKEELTFRLNRLFNRQTKIEVVDPHFSLIIPSIGASGKIVSLVDPNNQTEYLDALKNGIAHAKGTAYPGQGKTIYLFAHSTDTSINFARYNAIFYLIKELRNNDEIEMYYEGKKYTYQVFDKKIVSPTDVSYLNEQNPTEQLILQTCYPPGTTWKRLLVFAKKV